MPVVGNQVMGEEEYQAYLRIQTRARRALERGGQPTMKGQRDYYLRMAEDREVPRHERRQWKKLADELSRRLNDSDEKAKAWAEAQDQLM